jgi:hypothetical protein
VHIRLQDSLREQAFQIFHTKNIAVLYSRFYAGASGYQQIFYDKRSSFKAPRMSYLKLSLFSRFPFEASTKAIQKP